MEQAGSHQTVVHEIWYLSTFRNPSTKLTFDLNLKRITSTLHEDLSQFTVQSLRILLRMRNVADESRKEKYIQLIFIFFSEKSWYL